MGGHSFGGMTAIAVSNKDDRVKATFGMDPWVWVVTEDLDAGTYKVKQP
jgi:cephalosporin-C deacetylase-like acetyl esterase